NDQVLECTGNRMATSTLDGSASSDPDSSTGTNDDIVSFEWTEEGVPVASGEVATASFSVGRHDVVLTVGDSHGAAGSDGVTVSVVDTERPELTCPTALTSEFTTDSGAEVTFSTRSTDLCSSASVACAPPSGSVLPIGTTRIRCTARDEAGLTSTCEIS